VLQVYRVVLPPYAIVCAISAWNAFHHDALLAGAWMFQSVVGMAAMLMLLRYPEHAQRVMQGTFAALVTAFLVRVADATAFAAGGDVNLQNITAPLIAGSVVTHTIFADRAARRFNKLLAVGATSIAVLSLMLRASIQSDHMLAVARFGLCAFGTTYLTEFMSALQREHTRLRSDHATMERLALSDSLTQLANRRACEMMLEREIARSQRHGDPLSVILVDVDKFKAVNDRFGHDAGDAVLAGLARVFREHLRASDEPARWAGDEFLIILSSTPIQGALVVAERLRAAVAQCTSLGVGGVTASFGAASLDPENDDLARLVRRADKSLYRAKAAGRNCAVAIGRS
jgi:diguanylate cyclase (GGDEF)-like protein